MREPRFRLSEECSKLRTKADSRKISMSRSSAAFFRNVRDWQTADNWPEAAAPPSLGLVNTSRMGAIMPYLKIVSSRNAGIDGFGLDGNRNHGLLQKPWDRGLFAGAADDAVHPGQSLPVTKLIVEIEDGEDEWVISGSRESEIEISYECGCSNAQMRAGSLTVTTSELRTTLGRKR